MKIGGMVLCGVLYFCFWIVGGDDDDDVCGIYNFNFQESDLDCLIDEE